MRILLSFVLVLIPFSPILRAGADQRAPVPDADSQAKAETLVRETYKEDYAKAKQPADKLTLANLLFKEALETLDNPAARFVLLKQACDLAVEAGAIDTSLRSIDQMASEYEIKLYTMKADLLDKAASNNLTPTQNATLAGHALALSEAAIVDEQFNEAERLNILALTFVRSNPTLSQQAKDPTLPVIPTSQRPTNPAARSTQSL